MVSTLFVIFKKSAKQALLQIFRKYFQYFHENISVDSEIKKIKESPVNYFRLWNSPKIYVYTMGRVGTRSYGDSIKENYPVKPVKIHYMGGCDNNLEFRNELFWNHTYNWPEETGVKRKLTKEQIIAYGSRHKSKLNSGGGIIITGVRDPVEQGFSRFFFNFNKVRNVEKLLHYYGLSKYESSYEDWENAYLKYYNHEVPLHWFDEEFYPATGIDVYTYPFNKEKGYQIIEASNLKVLIIKLETTDEIKREALSTLLGIEDVVLRKFNTSGKRGDQQLNRIYRNMKKEYSFQTDHVESLLDSKYCKHFYTLNEIEGFKQKWLKKVSIRKPEGVIATQNL